MKVNNTPRACRPFLAGLSVVIAVVLISSFALAQSDPLTRSGTHLSGISTFIPERRFQRPAAIPTIQRRSSFRECRKGSAALSTYNFAPHFGLEGDFGYNWDTSSGSSEWTARRRTKVYRAHGQHGGFLHALASFNRVTYKDGSSATTALVSFLAAAWTFHFTKMFSWRVFGADYVWALHNFARLRGSRISAVAPSSVRGRKIANRYRHELGGAPELVPAAACSVQPTEVLVGEPITATVTPSNFNPKHTVDLQLGAAMAAQVTEKIPRPASTPTNAAPGTYAVTAHVPTRKPRRTTKPVARRTTQSSRCRRRIRRP